mmetsp:Transcript_71067/g.143044  ORF Transcript_71067/g.143044 Transcript_71067/m.143044 type:complete len:247 (+) Transcript_71067:82-822(+)
MLKMAGFFALGFFVLPALAVTCDPGFLVGGEDCVACDAGKYQKSADVCEDCPVGKFAPHGAAACSDCGTGRYASKKGTKSCTYCDAGKYSTFTAQTGACVESCKAGSYAPQGVDQCYKCSLNSYQPEEIKGECSFCRTAKFAGASECFDGANTFSTAALIAVVVLGALGIATSCRRQCEQVSDVLNGKLFGNKENEQEGRTTRPEHVFNNPAPGLGEGEAEIDLAVVFPVAAAAVGTSDIRDKTRV